MSEIDRIRDQMERAFRGPAWSGPSLVETLEGVSPAEAEARPLAGAHAIAEIARHAAVWKREVARRLGGAPWRELDAREDWPGEPRDWNGVRADLADAHRELLAAVARLDEAALEGRVGRDSVYVTLHGVIQHDLYHAGQVALLRRARAGQ